MVKLLYFMRLAELIGCSQEELALPRTINKKIVDCSSSVRDGDEIALFPKGR